MCSAYFPWAPSTGSTAAVAVPVTLWSHTVGSSFPDSKLSSKTGLVWAGRPAGRIASTQAAARMVENFMGEVYHLCGKMGLALMPGVLNQSGGTGFRLTLPYEGRGA